MILLDEIILVNNIVRIYFDGYEKIVVFLNHIFEIKFNTYEMKLLKQNFRKGSIFGNYYFNYKEVELWYDDDELHITVNEQGKNKYICISHETITYLNKFINKWIK